VSTVRVSHDSSLPPDRVLAAASDFSERRAEVFPAVSVERMEVHELGDTSADVTEGTRAGPIVNWERCDYDWSQPGSVKADVTDSNIYDPDGSWWELRATPKAGGSQVEMIWERNFKGTPRGILFGSVFRMFGTRIFNGYAREILENLANLERDR
jgi:hypothetical protein